MHRSSLPRGRVSITPHINDIAHVIQLAVAPVFLLSGVGVMLTVFTNRLGRIIDRARGLEERLEAGTAANVDAAYWELGRLRVRGRFVNAAVGLLVICAMLIGATVVTLFLGETLAPTSERLVPFSFLGGIVCFVLALIFFLVETLLASHTLRFVRRPAHK